MIGPTPTQIVFALCFIFGPMFGFFAAYKCRNKSPGMTMAFIIVTFCAYAGWLLSAIAAVVMLPRYPLDGTPESTAILFTVPGFVTGIASMLVVAARQSSNQ
jgi:hypothetical protein